MDELGAKQEACLSLLTRDAQPDITLKIKSKALHVIEEG
jgi:hypothetical protein